MLWQIAMLPTPLPLAWLQTPEEELEGPAELLFLHGGHQGNVFSFAWSPTDEWMIASVCDRNLLQVTGRCGWGCMGFEGEGTAGVRLGAPAEGAQGVGPLAALGCGGGR
jgi:hypothetical protein